MISIHAPREGSDPIHCAVQSDVWNFNPRSPRGERRAAAMRFEVGRIFQSTLPARGATAMMAIAPASSLISIHAPREGSDIRRLQCGTGFPISIHALREGSDPHGDCDYVAALISIHAPREGSDW